MFSSFDGKLALPIFESLYLSTASPEIEMIADHQDFFDGGGIFWRDHISGTMERKYPLVFKAVDVGRLGGTSVKLSNRAILSNETRSNPVGAFPLLTEALENLLYILISRTEDRKNRVVNQHVSIN